MVDHVATLLLNEGREAAVAAGCPWGVDPEFIPVRPGVAEAGFLSDLFSGADGVSGRARAIVSLVPFLEMPDMRRYAERFDRRSTMRPSASTPSGFSRAAASCGRGAPDIGACLSSRHAQGLFAHVGDDGVDAVLDELSSVFNGGFEAPHRFSALLYAVAERLDLERRGR